MNLYKYNKNGKSVTFDFEIKEKKNETIVDFIETYTDDNNKWEMPAVVTDKVVRRFLIAPKKECFEIDIEKLIGYIQANFDGSLSVTAKIKLMSEKSSILKISMPTGLYDIERGIPTDPRRNTDTFYPLIVTLNNKDISHIFCDYDIFQHNAVDKAYDCIINGNVPEFKNDLCDTEQQKHLHENWF